MLCLSWALVGTLRVIVGWGFRIGSKPRSRCWCRSQAVARSSGPLQWDSRGETQVMDEDVFSSRASVLESSLCIARWHRAHLMFSLRIVGTYTGTTRKSAVATRRQNYTLVRIKHCYQAE
ncbi:hypothetical protein EV363DRAFT_1415953 [Boletus edulis]|nr:hypothetical protein EV363DRAFT_1415953 [Boletus edulis]